MKLHAANAPMWLPPDLARKSLVNGGDGMSAPAGGFRHLDPTGVHQGITRLFDGVFIGAGSRDQLVCVHWPALEKAKNPDGFPAEPAWGILRLGWATVDILRRVAWLYPKCAWACATVRYPFPALAQFFAIPANCLHRLDGRPSTPRR